MAEPKQLRAIVLDESLEVSCRAHAMLSPFGFQVAFASSVQELALAFDSAAGCDLLVINLGGDVSGWQVAELVRRTHFGGKILALASDLADPGLSYMKELSGAECVVRPSAGEILDQLLKRLVSGNGAGPSPGASGAAPLRTFHGMVAKSKQMLEIFSRIEKVATGDASICIYGESGTGKELIARAIHYSSDRRNGPLITLDCTAVPDGLMESHLFGHVKGAFTGAVDHREGVFSLAHTGTLFIDELCELSLPLQAKLLRVIQTREFGKVGGTRPIRTNIRLITATNKDPKRQVENGSFREDLYYRVAVVMIKVPPLRERREDIPLLVEHFLDKFTAVYHKPIRAVSRAVMDRLMACSWPGNVRQLENVLEQAVVLAEGDTLTDRDLSVEDCSFPVGGRPVPVQMEPGLPLREVERRYILRTLQKVRGNRTQAAKLLGISTRCLQYKLKSYFMEGPVERPAKRVASSSIMTRGALT